jgi:hypothetical protein
MALSPFAGFGRKHARVVNFDIALDQFILGYQCANRLTHLRITPEVRRAAAIGNIRLTYGEGDSAMNCSIATADRATHLKIVVVAFFCSTAFLVTAILVH